jgi:hypothetical protein
MAGQFNLYVYRRLCRVDAEVRELGWYGPPRFEYMAGTEADMRFYFAEFRNNPQVLAVELRNHLGEVEDRFDRLVDSLPNVDAAALRLAVLEPRLLAELPASPRSPGQLEA